MSGPWLDWIRQVLIDDQGAPVKQRHTAKRIGDRLAAEHGVVISESRVRTVVARLRAELAAPDVGAVMVPQEHPPGAEAEVDWGDFTAVIGGVAMKLQLFVMRASHSTAGFHRAYAHAAQESWLDGHVRGFARLGGVPRRVRYDNLKTAVTKILTGRGRIEMTGSPRCGRSTCSTRSSASPGSRALMRRAGWKVRSAGSDVTI